MPRVGGRTARHTELYCEVAALLIAPVHALCESVRLAVVGLVPPRVLKEGQGHLRQEDRLHRTDRRHELAHEDALLPMRADDDALGSILVLELGASQRGAVEVRAHLLLYLGRDHLHYARRRAKGWLLRHDATEAQGALSDGTRATVHPTLISSLHDACCRKVDIAPAAGTPTIAVAGTTPLDGAYDGCGVGGVARKLRRTVRISEVPEQGR
mmetsp:Transcript_131402/g.294003  ORF Transcript_131402/g.294003 Transcript_131402/m.294003 type:complete len:212 (+) Transcript_131402:699-1334(+)